MRMRYKQVTYRYIEGSQHRLEQHYRRLLHDALRQGQSSLVQSSTTWRPLADILESPQRMLVKVELAGVQEDEIEVTLYQDALVVSGVRRNASEYQESLCYHEAQIRYGPFRLEVFIPYPVNRDAVTARYECGFLWVDIPKQQIEQKPLPSDMPDE
ncbi:HSP20 family protein [Thermosporothrix hazakensis]|jgi:HSP20 family molecular chaperone IbpA|uniref:HSP20 family protein n=2 Tax=Thermosporothrix hazakensis TaxID=644383 RepID=A0A326U0N5_THEHA|nr:HSP20 family protein [Thermosporothrix hazakensis]GCE47727.1 hypothetical protein KTH_25960 [Thermosporothrix hazakensis]